MPGFLLLLLFSIQYLHCLCCAVLFCLIVSLVYKVIDVVFIFRSLSTTSKKCMGTHIQWICPACTDTSDTVSFRRKSPFSWIVTSRQKGFQSFPCSLYNINCTKCIQNKYQCLLRNQSKFFVKLSFSVCFSEKKGRKSSVSSEIKSYLLFFNTQKLTSSIDVWEHFLSSNISVLAIKSCLLSFLTNWHPAGFSCIFSEKL